MFCSPDSHSHFKNLNTSSSHVCKPQLHPLWGWQSFVLHGTTSHLSEVVTIWSYLGLKSSWGQGSGSCSKTQSPNKEPIHAIAQVLGI